MTETNRNFEESHGYSIVNSAETLLLTSRYVLT